tara:strand:+ start:203 stop:352 length:150 start_codon:yes stop_codon:yes gene_type:complete
MYVNKQGCARATEQQRKGASVNLISTTFILCQQFTTITNNAAQDYLTAK